MAIQKIDFGEDDAVIYPSKCVVSISDGFVKPFKVVPFLYCDRLRLACGPEVDQATLSYDYGNILQISQDVRPIVYHPKDLQGKLVKIQVSQTKNLLEKVITWYGVIDVDQRQADGGDRFTDNIDSYSSGKQQFTVYGFLHLLDRTYVRDSWINQGDAGVLKIGRGLTFNGEIEERFRFAELGNLDTREPLSNPDNPSTKYLFSDDPQEGTRWTAWSAANYIVATHPILDRAGAAVHCRIEGQPKMLDWYDIQVATDTRSVKQILDDLIPHRRGVSYTVQFDETELEVVIRPFTFASEAVAMPREKELPANPNQFSFKFDKSVWVDSAIVRNTLATRYHKVLAQGEFKTSTFTLACDYLQFSPGWTDEEEERYKTAASLDAGYSLLSLYQKCARNAVYRASDFVASVYRRFMIDPRWNQRTFDHDLFIIDPDNEPQWFVAPPSDSKGVPIPRYDAEANPTGEPLWTRGIRLEKRLPLLEHYDYSGARIAEHIFDKVEELRDAPEFLPPLFFIRTREAYIEAAISGQNWNVPIPDRWENVELMAANSDMEDPDEGRDWAVHATIREHAPQVDLIVSGAGRQHFLAPSRFTGAADFDVEQDPEVNGGIDYSEGRLRGTICIQLDARVSAEKEITAATPGEPVRTLIIPVPEARLDFVVPGTVVQVKNGKLVKTSSGGFVRDDRYRVRTVAAAAAQWYGRTRQALKVEVRKTVHFLELGWLITTIGPEYEVNDVHTPITAIEFDFLKTSTTFETSFTDLEFT